MYFYRCDRRYLVHDSRALQPSFVRFMGEGATIQSASRRILDDSKVTHKQSNNRNNHSPRFCCISAVWATVWTAKPLSFMIFRMHLILAACLPWDFCCFLRRLSCIKGNVAQNFGERCRSQNIHMVVYMKCMDFKLCEREHYTILLKGLFRWAVDP